MIYIVTKGIGHKPASPPGYFIADTTSNGAGGIWCRTIADAIEYTKTDGFGKDHSFLRQLEKEIINSASYRIYAKLPITLKELQSANISETYPELLV